MTSWSWPRAPKAAPPSRGDAQQYKVGLQLLEKIRRRDESQEEWIDFVSLILYACKKAIAWKPEISEPIYRLKNFNEFHGDLKLAVNGLEKILKVARKHRYIFDIVALYAQDSIGLTGEICVKLDICKYDAPLTRNLLQALLVEFNRPRGEIRQRYLERWNGDDGLRMMRVAGPLCFPEVIEGRKLPDLRLTGLQFELSFLLRRYTAGFSSQPIVMGDDIPRTGRPCYPVVAEFIRSSIRPEFSDDKGQAFLKVLRQNRCSDGNGIIWSGWEVQGMAEAPGGEINIF